jgi:hypothetical protein
MSFIDVGGISKLSQLTIDADKIWLDKGISNIKEIVLGMTEGDIAFFNGTQLVKLSPGVLGSEVKTKGPGADPIYGFPDTLP